MQLTPVAIFGASGYSGIELARLCASHPALEVRLLTSDRWVGEDAVDRLGCLAGEKFVAHDEGISRAELCAVAFLATPAEVSLKLAPQLVAKGVKVIDLSGAFRLKDHRLYPRFYGFEHTELALLQEAVYGLPELFRKELPTARLVANPGCYPTAAVLSIAPLLQAGLAVPGSIVINAASGVSGAGRKASEEYTFMEIDDDVRAYKVLRHQHGPEIRQTLSRGVEGKVELVFTPHLLPLKRGILNTTVATLKPNTTEVAVRAAYQRAFAKEPFVQLLPSAEAVRLVNAALTPKCLVGVSLDGERVVAISAIDNLLKGAASQAVQNLNLMLGVPEITGLLPESRAA